MQEPKSVKQKVTFSMIWPIWAARKITSSTPLAFSGFTNAIRATEIWDKIHKIIEPLLPLRPSSKSKSSDRSSKWASIESNKRH